MKLVKIGHQFFNPDYLVSAIDAPAELVLVLEFAATPRTVQSQGNTTGFIAMGTSPASPLHYKTFREAEREAVLAWLEKHSDDLLQPRLLPRPASSTTSLETF